MLSKRIISLSNLDNLEAGRYDDYVTYPEYNNNIKKIILMLSVIIFIIGCICLFCILLVYNFFKDFIY
jgi:hypothetical protein